jgi:hypothetical protein
MLVVEAERSAVGEGWLDHPQVKVVTTQGDHLSMCHPPYVQGVVDEVTAFVTSCREVFDTRTSTIEKLEN